MSDVPPLTALTEEERAVALDRFRRLRPHLEDGLPLARLARAEGIPLRTARRWVHRYRDHGLAGLARVPRADRGTRTFPADLIHLIEGLALRTPALSAAGSRPWRKRRTGQPRATAPSTTSSATSTPGW
jgi:putative transposase